MYATINPRPFKMTQVMTIRLSHVRDSSTVRPDLEKFIKSRATAEVTTAATVEIPTILLYTSCMIVCAFVHTVSAAKTG